MNYPKNPREGFTLVEIMIVAAIIALLAALAFPAWQKIRLRSISSLMDNDARQLASAAQQYFMENSATSVSVGYVAGAITGPLSDRVHFVGREYVNVGPTLTVTDNFSMEHPLLPAARVYNSEGQYQQP